jgi:hypothetical protein
MKTTDFIKENFVTDAAEAHQDHEVQMARSDCYNAAKYAIELHKLLKNISEQQGLEGWVSEKITLANDYLRTVTEYLRYEQESSARSDMPAFDISSATQTLDSVLGESATRTLEEGAFTWYLKAHGRLLSPLTSDEPYKFNSKEEAIEFAKQKYKTNWQNIVPTTYDVPNSLENQPDAGWNEKKLKPVAAEGTVEEARKPMVNFDAEDLKKLEKIRDLETLKTQAFMLISRPSEKPMKPEKVAWFKSALERMNSPLKVIKLMYDLLLSGEGHAVIGSKSSMDPNSYRARFNEQDVEEGKADPVGSWVVYDGSKVKRFKSREGAKAYAEKNGGKVASSEHYADKVQKQGVAEGEQGMSRAAKGHEKYGKEGMQALAKAGREGASEKELDTIRDKHDKYDESIDEAAKKGLYYYVNKRKKAGTSRDADHPDAPSPQDWKNAAKTAKKESVEEGSTWYAGNGAIKEKIAKYEELALAANRAGDDAKTKMYQQKIQTLKQKMSHMEESAGGMGAASVASSMGGGNGFVNGGPGTIARPKMKKKQ